MKLIKLVILTFLLLRVCVPLDARGWTPCTETVGCCVFEQKPPVSLGKRADVIPLGYPYGNDRSSRPYLAPYAHAAPYEFGQPFTFGYVAVESTGVKKPWKKKRVHSRHDVRTTPYGLEQPCVSDCVAVESTRVKKRKKRRVHCRYV